MFLYKLHCCWVKFKANFFSSLIIPIAPLPSLLFPSLLLNLAPPPFTFIIYLSISPFLFKFSTFVLNPFHFSFPLSSNFSLSLSPSAFPLSPSCSPFPVLPPFYFLIPSALSPHSYLPSPPHLLSSPFSSFLSPLFFPLSFLLWCETFKLCN